MAPSNKLNINDYKDDVMATGSLDLSTSQLQEVPVKDIVRLKRVTKLDLSSNKLTSLGANFATLTQLVKLNASNNQLKELPENIGDLKQLRHLDLSNNKLKNLPLSIRNLKNLTSLNLKNNPLNPALLKVAGACTNDQQCQQCAKKVIAYLEEQARNLGNSSAPQTPQAKSKNEEVIDDKKVKNKKAKNEKAALAAQQPAKKENKKAAVKPAENKNKKDKAKTDKKRAQKRKGSFVATLIKFNLIFAAVLLTGVFLAQKYPQQYNPLRNAVATQVNAAVSRLPENYQVIVYMAHEKTSLVLVQTLEVVKATATKLQGVTQHPYFKYAQTKLVQAYNDAYVKVLEWYTSTFDKSKSS